VEIVDNVIPIASGTSMKKSSFSEREIEEIVAESERTSIAEVCEKYTVSKSTLYRWRSRHGEQRLTTTRKLRKLEEENSRLRALVADLSLRNQAFKLLLSKKM
jgi:putative transposase